MSDELLNRSAEELAAVSPRVMWVMRGAIPTRDCGLSLVQFGVLKVLSHGARRPSELAERMIVSRPTITASIDRLLKRGLVKRHLDPQNRRQTILELTEEGERIIEKCQEEIVQRVAGRIVNGLTREEREALLTGLKAVRREIEAGEVMAQWR